MTPIPITYLSNDALTEGVGASQVLAYVERLARRGVEVTLHSFEKEPVTPALTDRLAAAGVRWIPHQFGRFGAIGGLQRLAEGARSVWHDELVHARADLAAASTMLAGPRRWVWDCRGLYPDQRVALGMLRAGSAEVRALRAIERAAARRSDGIITLTEAVLPVLEARHGPGIAAKAVVISTCVDTTRFAVAPLPPASPRRLLLAGTINAYYDVPLMAAIVEECRRRMPTELRVASPPSTAWDALIDAQQPMRSTHAPCDMPAVVADVHVGLSVCRDDAGVSLTGSMPTKIAEFLATGRPVIVNGGLGDAGRLVSEHRCGVVTRGSSPDEVRRVVDELDELLADPDLVGRCRGLAEHHFDLDRAVDAMVQLYQRVLVS